MCSVSTVNSMLKSGLTNDNSIINEISSSQLKKNRSEYLVIDLRESYELEDTVANNIYDTHIPLGEIIHDAKKAFEKRNLTLTVNSLTLCMICPKGIRAKIAAEYVVQQGYKACILQRGILGLTNPAATIPDLVVLLCIKDNPEKITLALAAW